MGYVVAPVAIEAVDPAAAPDLVSPVPAFYVVPAGAAVEVVVTLPADEIVPFSLAAQDIRF